MLRLDSTSRLNLHMDSACILPPVHYFSVHGGGFGSLLCEHQTLCPTSSKVQIRYDYHTMIDEHAVQVFGGAGIATLPMSCIVAFLRRPRATITRSEYIKVNNAAHQPFFCVWRSQYGVLAHIFDCLPRKLLQLVNDPRRSEN